MAGSLCWGQRGVGRQISALFNFILMTENLSIWMVSSFSVLHTILTDKKAVPDW